MGLGTVAAAMIIAAMIAITLFIFVMIFMTSVNYLYVSAQTSANRLANIVGSRLSIPSATYNPTTGRLCYNVSNDGSKSVVIANGLLTLIDYVSTVTRQRKIVLIPFTSTVVSRVFIGNKTVVVNSTTAVELLPGATVELCMNVNDINTTQPTVIVSSLTTGTKASRIITFD